MGDNLDKIRATVEDAIHAEDDEAHERAIEDAQKQALASVDLGDAAALEALEIRMKAEGNTAFDVFQATLITAMQTANQDDAYDPRDVLAVGNKIIQAMETLMNACTKEERAAVSRGLVVPMLGVLNMFDAVVDSNEEIERDRTLVEQASVLAPDLAAAQRELVP